jgi:hypothetical protein
MKCEHLKTKWQGKYLYIRTMKLVSALGCHVTRTCDVCSLTGDNYDGEMQEVTMGWVRS